MVASNAEEGVGGRGVGKVFQDWGGLPHAASLCKLHVVSNASK